MNEKIKECPFCGGEAKLVKNECGFAWSIFCNDCYAEMNTDIEENCKNLIVDWNRRIENE